MSDILDLLKPAEEKATRIKCLIYGGPGTGKTITSLQFPSTAFIDTEKGTEHYGKYFKFDRIQTTDWKTVLDIVNALIENPKQYKSFVIDSITSLYMSMLREYELKMKAKTGRADYVIQPADYKVPTNNLQGLINKILALDMNIIITAQSKALYREGSFMEKIGEQPDGPAKLSYWFDTTIHLNKHDGKFWGVVEGKDRTNCLPPEGEEFEFSYQSFVKYIGIEGLEREPVVLRQKQNVEDQQRKRDKVIVYKKKELKTAGIEADNVEKLMTLSKQIGEDDFKKKLQDDYFTDSILNLKNDEAVAFINDLEQGI